MNNVIYYLVGNMIWIVPVSYILYCIIEKVISIRVSKLFILRKRSNRILQLPALDMLKLNLKTKKEYFNFLIHETEFVFNSLEKYYLKSGKHLIKFRFDTNEIVIKRVEKHINEHGKLNKNYNIEFEKNFKKSKRQIVEKLPFIKWHDNSTMFRIVDEYSCTLTYKRI